MRVNGISITLISNGYRFDMIAAAAKPCIKAVAAHQNGSCSARIGLKQVLIELKPQIIQCIRAVIGTGNNHFAFSIVSRRASIRLAWMV